MATKPDSADLEGSARRRSRRAPAAAAPAAQRKPKLDAQGRAYATGKRKNAVARVWIKPGNGKITVNGRDGPVYFARPVLRMLLDQPFAVANRLGQFDVVCTVIGGGLSGQAGAMRHGISRALTYYEPELRPALKSRRLPHPRQPRRRAQEIRQGQGATQLPVLETLDSPGVLMLEGRPAGRPFSLRQDARGSMAIDRTVRIAILGASGYTGAELLRLLAQHPGCRDRGADRRPPGGQVDGERCSRIWRAASCPCWWRSTRSIGGGRSRLLLPAARHDAGGDRGAAAPLCMCRSLRRFPPRRYRELREMVRPRASRARAAARGGLWPDRDRARGGARARGSWPSPAAIRPARNCRWCRCVKAALIDADDIVIDAKSGVTGAGREPRSRAFLPR